MDSLPMSYLDPRGPVAAIQSGLLNLSLWFAMVIGTVVAVALIWVVMKFRERPGERREALQIHGNARLEILWTIIPILILVFMAVPMVRAAFAVHTPPSQTDLTIRATGVQWFFDFEYPEFGVRTANELYIPTGRPIKIEIRANDVIHSFWIPKLAGKMDMIPGRVNEMWIEADEPGEYFGQCAEFCGTAHALMRMRVFALAPAEWDAWIRGRQALAKRDKTPADPVAVRGKQLFEGADKSRATCFACHAVEGTPAKGLIGPVLTDIGARKTLGAAWTDNNAENLAKWIKKPQTIKPGAKMPAHEHLAEDEINALVAYLRTLK